MIDKNLASRSPAFDTLEPQGPFSVPEATAYAEQALSRSAEAAQRVRREADLPYGPHPRQRLDLYLPAPGSGGGLPVLVFLHGGRWIRGYKEWVGLTAPTIISLPAVMVAVSYRLAPEFRYPDPLHDALDALSWVHAHVAEYGGDPGRLYVGGHSAGGHLAALAVLRRDLARARGFPPEAVRACLPISSAFDLDYPDPQPGSAEAEIQANLFRRREDAAEASPINHVEGNTTPFLVVRGENDFPRILRSGAAMVEALRAQPGRVEELVLPGHNHFDTHLATGDPTAPWVRTVRAWMQGE